MVSMATFGEHVRKQRKARKEKQGNGRFSLRQVAGRVNIAPTYLSKIERGEVGPPSEKVIVKLAAELGEHPDVLLAMAGKVSARLQAAIMRRPKLFAEVIDQLERAPDEALLRVVREVRDGDW